MLCVSRHLLSKFVCHIANKHHTAILLNGYLDPRFLHMCAKAQGTEISTSHVIVMYVPPIICLLNATYPNQFKCTWHSYVSIIISYEFATINNVTRSTTIFTFHQICLHMFHGTTTVVYIQISNTS